MFKLQLYLAISCTFIIAGLPNLVGVYFEIPIFQIGGKCNPTNKTSVALSDIIIKTLFFQLKKKRLMGF